MSDVGGITGSPGVNGYYSPSSGGALSVAAALAALARTPASTVEISDSIQNIVKNLDALQAVAAKVTSLSTTDVSKHMVVTATQYQKAGTILARWGEGDDQTVGITNARATFTTTPPSYVTSVSVSDSSASIASHLDNLQTLTDSGLLSEIIQTGAPQDLSITAAQLVADADALGKIKNGAYTLAIKSATVSDTLGLGDDPALSTNTKVKSITIVDTTDAIADNLDALQKVGLRIKSISQTDAATPLSITGEQYAKDRLVLSKIISSDLLAVIDASSSQARALAADTRVVTVDIRDTAKNIARNWSLLQNLADLTSVEVSDQENAIQLTETQFAASESLLAKFTDTVDQTYKLAVTKVSAGTALAVANTDHVDTIEVSDVSADLATSMDDLQTIADLGKLQNVTLTTPRTAMTLDVSFLKGDELTATQAVLAKVKGGNYSVALTNVTTADLADLVSNKHLVSFAVTDSSDNIESNFTALRQLGKRLGTIDQTDSGTAFELTDTQLTANTSVLSKISGGYTVNLTDVLAVRAAANMRNVHVASVEVSDSTRNVVARWSTLLALGKSLKSVTRSDSDVISLSASNYIEGVQSDLVSKLGEDASFKILGATIAQAQSVAGDDVVTQIEVSDTSNAVSDNLTALKTLVTGGKLTTITNKTPTTSLSMDASDLDDAQAALDLIKGGSYSLSLLQVGAADAKGLALGNRKIVKMAVTGDAETIVTNLSDLNSLGNKLGSITQTDAPGTSLEMTGLEFERNAGALGKIQGRFLAVLSDVSANKAATFAANTSVSSLAVSDTGANIASAWSSMRDLGSKLTEVDQTDATTLQIGYDDWTHGQTLRGKFTSDPEVSISGVSVAQLADLAADDAVTEIQLQDSASAISNALSDLAAEAKLTQLALDDSDVPLTMTGADYEDYTSLLALVKNGDYTADLSAVSADQAVTLTGDAHVSSMDVSDTSAEIGTHFTALAAATNLNSIDLTDEDETITLTSAQILAGGETLDKISGAYELEATGVAMADLASIQDVPQVASIGVTDTSANVSEGISDLLALGDTLAQIHLTDGTPVLSMTEEDFVASSDVLAKVDGTYHVDVDTTTAASAATIGADNTVRYVLISDTAGSVQNNWDALVTLYNDGAGKLTEVVLTDSSTLTLTEAQQSAGASLLENLLSDVTVETAP